MELLVAGLLVWTILSAWLWMRCLADLVMLERRVTAVEEYLRKPRPEREVLEG